METHDFIDFVQRNGKDLVNMSDQNTLGSDFAVIVLIPKNFTRENILSWHLSKFAEFNKMECPYNWDTWEFEKLNGYKKCLATPSFWEQSVWESPDKPDFWLVNFHPDTYNSFVLGKKSARQIPKWYFELIFENRGCDLPVNREIAYEKIMNAREENLWLFHGKTVREFEFLPEYIALKEKLSAEKIFNTKYSYSLHHTPKSLSEERISFLITDRIHIVGNKMHKIRAHFVKCKSYNPGGISIFKFRFEPILNPFPTNNIKNCVRCGRRRWTGKLTCYKHNNENVKCDIDRIECQIRSYCNGQIYWMESFHNMPAPDRLESYFTEKIGNGRIVDFNLAFVKRGL